MTVTITLAPELEAEVTAHAQAEGVALEDYLPQLIKRSLPYSIPFEPVRQGSSEWLALLYQTPALPSSQGTAVPLISRDDLRRENLYEDRA
jgi:hypothetical protein